LPRSKMGIRSARTDTLNTLPPAGPDEFRTAPLWGVGQRIFFLHDGRTSDLLQAILDHSGQNSEANRVINVFQALGKTQKQDLLNFLRSL
jgi:CxxC motif-containing protein (DUF1111 family)